MRRGLLSLLALALSVPVLYGAATARQSLETAALRIVVLAIGVGILDRYAAPLVTALLRSLGGGSTDDGNG